MTRDPLAHVVYRATVGSHAYGLATPASDRDTRGVYAPPTAWFWGLAKPPDQVESTGTGVDEVVFEVEKFLRLALKGSPTVLEVLWAPDYEATGPAGDRLRALRGAFLSQACVAAYLGYAQAQAALVRRKAAAGQPWAKPAAHLVRLLHAGVHLCRTGEVMVHVGGHRPELLAVRAGGGPAGAVAERAAELTAALTAAAAACGLPATPDVAAAEAYLADTRRARV